MPRAGLTQERIAATAAEIADEVGLDQLTLAAVAKRLNVSGPAIYKHRSGLDDLQRDVAVLAVNELTATLSAATVGRAGSDALRALADAYRGYARRHPGRLAASLRAPAPDDTEHIAAADAALTVLTGVLRAYDLSEHDLVDALRTLRAALHGFAAVENAGGFGLPRDIDATYARYIDTLDAGLRSWRRAPSVQSLSTIRAEIDALDDQIVDLLAQRQQLVKRAAAFKRDADEVRGEQRRRLLMERLRERAADAGLDPRVVDAVWTAMIDVFVALELSEHDALK
jgi:chorismate mutase